MARPSSIDKLPEDIRNGLHNELLYTNFTDYDHVYSWLTEKGFKISRSAIHRYAVSRKDKIIAMTNEVKIPKATLRLTALNIALQMHPDSELNDLQERAELILKWAFTA